MAPLYDALEKHAGIVVIGFADDTNIMAYSQSAYDNCRRLERAWQTFVDWANYYGMQFEPAKSALLYFTRCREPPRDCVFLDDSTVKEPVTHTRFLDSP